jgi:hypothetical protein
LDWPRYVGANRARASASFCRSSLWVSVVFWLLLSVPMDDSLMTLLCLNHLDVRTSPSGGHRRAPDLPPIMRNEQQRLTLFNAELSQGCSVAESGWG